MKKTTSNCNKKPIMKDYKNKAVNLLLEMWSTSDGSEMLLAYKQAMAEHGYPYWPDEFDNNVYYYKVGAEDISYWIRYLFSIEKEKD